MLQIYRCMDMGWGTDISPPIQRLRGSGDRSIGRGSGIGSGIGLSGTDIRGDSTRGGEDGRDGGALGRSVREGAPLRVLVLAVGAVVVVVVVVDPGTGVTLVRRTGELAVRVWLTHWL